VSHRATFWVSRARTIAYRSGPRYAGAACVATSDGGPGPGAAVYAPIGMFGPVEVARITEGELKADSCHRPSCSQALCNGALEI
jgi:hypothetical protein